MAMIPVVNPRRGEATFLRIDAATELEQHGHGSIVNGKWRWRIGPRERAVIRRMIHQRLMDCGYDAAASHGVVDLTNKRRCNLPFAGDRMNVAKISSGRETNERLRRRQAERKLLGIA